MEEVDKDPDEAPEPSVFQNEKFINRVLSQDETEAGLSEEHDEQLKQESSESWLQEEEVEEREKTSNLQRDLLMTKIQTEADSKELMRRTELEEAHRLRVLSHKDEVEQDLSEELCEQVNQESGERQLQAEEVEESEKITSQRIINLQRDLTALVTNIQTAADAKESKRRTELEEDRRIRLERLENHVKFSQEQFEEISRGWLIVNEKVSPQELQKALSTQQPLCSALIESKKKLISDLQQELKAVDDRFVKDLRKQEEELNLMMVRMEEQFKTLAEAYSEDVAQMEIICQQESELLLTRDKTEWEQHMRELLDKEINRLTQRKGEVEEYENTIHMLILETFNKANIVHPEWNTTLQERQLQGSNMTKRLKKIRSENEVSTNIFNLNQMKKNALSLQTELQHHMKRYTIQMKQITKRNWYLSEDYKCKIEQYERMQKKIRHFGATDGRKIIEMWLMIEAEVKQLVQRALVIDSQLCKQHLGLSWEHPPMTFMELPRPIQLQKQINSSTQQAVSQLFHMEQAVRCSQESMETHAKSTCTKMYKRGTAVSSESVAEVEKLSTETLRKVMELLCDETGFLMEEKLLKLLSPLDKEEQIVVKMGSLISHFGIGNQDLPKLALFLLKHKQQQTEDGRLGADSDLAEAVESSSTTDLSSDFHPSHVLPALKSFLEQHMRSRESSACQDSYLLDYEGWDSSENKTYWEKMSNIISEDQVHLWESAEKILKQCHEVFTEIFELSSETEHLEQQNSELRRLLQQSLLSQHRAEDGTWNTENWKLPM